MSRDLSHTVSPLTFCSFSCLPTNSNFHTSSRSTAVVMESRSLSCAGEVLANQPVAAAAGIWCHQQCPGKVRGSSSPEHPFLESQEANCRRPRRKRSQVPTCSPQEPQTMFPSTKHEKLSFKLLASGIPRDVTNIALGCLPEPEGKTTAANTTFLSHKT